MTYKPFPDNDITRDEALYIREIQNLLRALELSQTGSSSVPVDGIYGPMTTAAVENFQRQENLPVTGIVDRNTYYRIVEQYNALLGREFFTVPIEAFSPEEGYQIRPGDTGDAVIFLNVMLQGIADLFRNVPRPSSIDSYSDTTEAAVRTLQSIFRLPATGIVNRQTWNGIANLYNDLVNRLRRQPNTEI